MSLLTVVHGRGTTAAKPAAAAANEGYIYFDTTLGKLQRSNGATWDDIAETASAASFVGAKAYHSTTQSIADVTLVVLSMDSEEFDTSAFHSTATNTSRMTIPTGVTGYFRFKGTTSFATNGTGRRVLSLKKNGTTVLTGSSTETTPSAAGGIVLTHQVSSIASLVPTDYVELEAYQSSGAAMLVGQAAVGGSTTTLEVEFLGP